MSVIAYFMHIYTMCNKVNCEKYWQGPLLYFQGNIRCQLGHSLCLKHPIELRMSFHWPKTFPLPLKKKKIPHHSLVLITCFVLYRRSAAFRPSLLRVYCWAAAAQPQHGTGVFALWVKDSVADTAERVPTGQEREQKLPMGRKGCSGRRDVWGEEEQWFCETLGGCRVIVSIQC